YWSMDLVSLVTPSPLWGPGMDVVGDGPGLQAPIGATENTAYLGISVLLLAAAAIFSMRKRPDQVAFWMLVFFSFAILALGPYLYVGGSKTISLFGTSFSLPLPYQILDRLPLVGARRAPTRMIVFGICALAALAGIGFNAVSTRISLRHRRLVPIFTLLIFGLIVLEYWNPPVNTSSLARPAVLEEISREDGEFT